MNKENKTPLIRFKGFSDDWEQRKLGEVGKKLTEKNLDLDIQETFTNSAEFGIISQRDFFDHDISNAENIGGYYVVKNDDFVYNPRISVTAPVGPVNRNKLGRSGVMSPLYTVFRTHNIDTLYLEWFFKSSYWHSFMYLNGDSGARADRFSIKDNVFFDMPIPYPQLAEQQKIGSYFKSLDNLITLHQRKCESLKKVKKSMLQKMFPKNGESVPEIRFAGFTDDWEQRKLDEVVEFYSGLTYSPKDVSKSGTLVLRSSNVQNGEIVTDDNVYVDSTVVDSQNVRVGDIIVVVRNGSRALIGKHAQIKQIMQNTVIGAFMTGIRCSESNFMNALLSTTSFEKEVAMNMGATINQITGYMFSNMQFLVPSLAEQAKIGSYFQSLDNLITLHQRKVEKLKNIKKSMLQKMFV